MRWKALRALLQLKGARLQENQASRSYYIHPKCILFRGIEARILGTGYVHCCNVGMQGGFRSLYQATARGGYAMNGKPEGRKGEY